MIILSTSLTPNFMPRGRDYYSDLKARCNVPVRFFAVDFDEPPAELSWAEIVMVRSDDYQVTMPKTMLQHGGFCQFMRREWSFSDVIIFTDGDGRFQRPFTKAELHQFDTLAEGELLIGPNFPEPQTLNQEAPRIFPKQPQEVIAKCFPTYEMMFCRNTGFVVARLSTWNCLFQAACALMPAATLCFDNAALVQFVMCYAIQADPWFSLRDLPLTVHSHGHVGIFPGVTKTERGWEYQGELIAFAHAL